MSGAPLTDRHLSHIADEFVWDTDDSTRNHDFIAGPILRLLKSHRCESVLDLGCGNGSLTARLVADGYRAEGCDSSVSGVNIARQTFPDIAFWQHDISTPLVQRLQGRYDAVVAADVIEHLLLPRSLMQAAIQALRPGGLLIVTTPFHGYWKNLALALTNKFDDHWHPLRDFGHVKFFSRATLARLFAEFHFSEFGCTTAGRVPAFARSMIAYGTQSRNSTFTSRLTT